MSHSGLDVEPSICWILGFCGFDVFAFPVEGLLSRGFCGGSGMIFKDELFRGRKVVIF